MASRWCSQPRLRKQWQSSEAQDALAGRVTQEEKLWVVLVTMGVAAMRSKFVYTSDLEWWLLHALVFVGIVFSSTSYCCNFNDTDLFHQALWALWLAGLLSMIACVDVSLPGFAGSTAFLYGLMTVARLRVAVRLPRARPLSLFFAVSSGTSVLLFAALALYPERVGAYERRLLWGSAAIEPGATLAFVAVASVSPERAAAWDVPFDVVRSQISQTDPHSRHTPVRSRLSHCFAQDYLLSRLEGFHMMIIVCSFLFPLGLQGARITTSGGALAALLLANTFAALLKLSIMDIDPGTRGDALLRHALRRSNENNGPHVYALRESDQRLVDFAPFIESAIPRTPLCTAFDAAVHPDLTRQRSGHCAHGARLREWRRGRRRLPPAAVRRRRAHVGHHDVPQGAAPAASAGTALDQGRDADGVQR